jgi:hypothetical protein
MLPETTINRLIETGWHIHNNGNIEALLNWRDRGIECLTTLMGADHAYIDFFRDFVEAQESRGILAATGILFAVRQRIADEGTARAG